MDEVCKPVKDIGLRGVTIASTRISDVDGERGRLIYRGYLVKDLAEKATFEEIAFLLLFERLPNKKELKSFSAHLAAERTLSENVVAAMTACPKDSRPMDILQAMVPLLVSQDSEIRAMVRENAEKSAVRLIAKLATIVAAWHRIRNGLAPISPNPALGHAANFLYMMNGTTPLEEVARYFDVALVLHAEHSFNASTFAAREVASTRAHMYAAISAAIGSLSGELHGGANARVMEMLMKIASPDHVDAYLKETLDSGGLIMGLGHAVYKTDDPRAFILAPMSKDMGERTGQPQWYQISKELEQKGKAAFKERKGINIFVNVDFYSASLYHSMGIPIDLFTPIFAISRVAGWTAHVIEEQYSGAGAKPTLYRPESDYVGDYCGPDVCSFTPIENR
jgi:citrate synthase